jgi:hypothetical protein
MISGLVMDNLTFEKSPAFTVRWRKQPSWYYERSKKMPLSLTEEKVLESLLPGREKKLFVKYLRKKYQWAARNFLEVA